MVEDIDDLPEEISEGTDESDEYEWIEKAEGLFQTKQTPVDIVGPRKLMVRSHFIILKHNHYQGLHNY